MVKIMCLRNFFDIEANINRHVGDKWEVSKARATAILNHNEKGLIEIISVEPEQVVVKPKAKRIRGKA
jgi:hypothetical protein